MTRDRFAEFKIKYSAVNDGTQPIKENPKIEISPTFFTNFEKTQNKIKEVEKYVEEVKACQLKILSTPNRDEKTNFILDELMRQIKVLSTIIRSDLKCSEDELESNSLLNTGCLDRIKSQQHAALLNRFKRAMEVYNNNNLQYRSKCKGRIKLQLQIAGTSVSENDVEEMFESGNPYVFTEAVMQKTETAKRSLMEIEARHADIIKLERSIEEMKDIFSNISLIVDQQGDLIDNVEHCVSNAVESIQKADLMVEKAVKSNKRNRKMKIICIIILVIVILLILISIAGALGFN